MKEEQKNLNLYRLLKLNNKKTIMASPITINYLDLYWQQSPSVHFNLVSLTRLPHRMVGRKKKRERKRDRKKKKKLSWGLKSLLIDTSLWKWKWKGIWLAQWVEYVTLISGSRVWVLRWVCRDYSNIHTKYFLSLKKKMKMKRNSGWISKWFNEPRGHMKGRPVP